MSSTAHARPRPGIAGLVAFAAALAACEPTPQRNELLIVGKPDQGAFTYRLLRSDVLVDRRLMEFLDTPILVDDFFEPPVTVTDDWVLLPSRRLVLDYDVVLVEHTVAGRAQVQWSNPFQTTDSGTTIRLADSFGDLVWQFSGSGAIGYGPLVEPSFPPGCDEDRIVNRPRATWSALADGEYTWKGFTDRGDGCADVLLGPSDLVWTLCDVPMDGFPFALDTPIYVRVTNQDLHIDDGVTEVSLWSQEHPDLFYFVIGYCARRAPACGEIESAIEIGHKEYVQPLPDAPPGALGFAVEFGNGTETIYVLRANFYTAVDPLCADSVGGLLEDTQYISIFERS